MTGMDFQGRYYGSALGRFTSPDWSDKLEPIPYANLLYPQTLNLYAYVRNNPVSKPDPDGHCPSDDSAACSANLSVKQVSAIVQNETQSLHDRDAKNPQLDTMKKDVAHAVINGDNKLGDKRPITAPDTVSDKQAKSDSFKATEKDVQCACQEAKQGTDPTSGATHFNLRPNDSEKDFQGAKIQTHDGPFSNSYPSAALPKGKDVYVNTYKDQPSPASKKDQDQ